MKPEPDLEATAYRLLETHDMARDQLGEVLPKMRRMGPARARVLKRMLASDRFTARETARLAGINEQRLHQIAGSKTNPKGEA